jgi:competence ComEA-like helix-hairpin-helix protein
MKRKIIFLLFSSLLLTFACLSANKIFALGTVEINTASLQQLETLTGIGAVKAQAIIDARPYSSIDDLLKAKGIGEKTLRKIKDQGLAYVDKNLGNQNSEPETNLNPQGLDDKGIVKAESEVIYPSGIYINEVLPNPEGADETEEWIELYNTNNFDVDLSGWQIKDIEGTTTTHTIKQNTIISANGFLVLKRPETKIMLNNDSDGLNLISPDKKIIHSVNFPKAPLGQSYNKTGSGWSYSTTLTQGATNILTAIIVKTNNKTLPNAKNSVNNKGAEAGLADLSHAININQENKQNNNPWFLFFITLATAIILATIVLSIKLKIKKNSSD